MTKTRLEIAAGILAALVREPAQVNKRVEAEGLAFSGTNHRKVAVMMAFEYADELLEQDARHNAKYTTK